MTSESTTSLGDILRLRAEHLGKALSIGHGKPLHISHGSMQYLYATDGTRYLDLVNNVCHVGHSNPRVVEAVQRQKVRLNNNNRYVYESFTAYLARLAATLPGPFPSLIHT